MSENEVAKQDKTAVAIAEIAERYKAITTIKDTAGYNLVVAGIRECRDLRVSVEKERQATVRQPLDFISATNAEAKRIIAEIESIETPLKVLKIADDKRKADLKAKKEREEAARVDAIQDKITALAPAAQHNWTVQQYDDAIKLLVAHEVTAAEYEEFVGKATFAHEAALAVLRSGREARVEFEEEQARLRADQKKVEAERAARNKIEHTLHVWITPGSTIEDLEAMVEHLERQVITDEIYSPLKDEAKKMKASSLAALANAIENKREQEAAQEAQENRNRAVNAIAEINDRITASLNYDLEALKGAVASLERLEITEEVFFDRTAEATVKKNEALTYFSNRIAQKKAEEEKAAADKAEAKRLDDLATAEALEKEEDERRQGIAQKGLNEIAFPLQNSGRFNSEGLRGVIIALENRIITEAVYYNRTGHAEELKASVLEQLREVLAQKEKTEAAEKKLRDEQAEFAATQKAEQDRKDKEVSKLKEEKEASEEAARVERLRPDNEKLASVAESISMIIESFPEVSEDEAAKIKGQAILALEEIRTLLIGQ